LLRGGDQGDLAVRSYDSETELAEDLRNVYFEELRRLCLSLPVGQTVSRLAAYTEAFGLKEGRQIDLDRLQVLAPYRLDVDQINEIVRRSIWGYGSKTMNGLATYDRVMQITNKTMSAFDQDVGQRTKVFVPNGQIGFVSEVSQQEYERFGKKVPVKFAPDYGRYKFDMTESMVEENLSFAYGLSIHKSQGSQFDTVIAVVPAKDSEFLSRELVYTLVTRAQKRLVLLLEKDAATMLSRTWGGYSELLKRNSALFRTARGWKRSDASKFRTGELIHEALPDLFVRSRGEATIARTLAALALLKERHLVQMCQVLRGKLGVVDHGVDLGAKRVEGALERRGDCTKRR
jgi:hypothetical protein